jgi:transposase InsO family protein
VDGTDELPENVGFQRHLRAQLSADSNAMCESFFATLECELLARTHFETRGQARQGLFSWIEGWYNVSRRHSGIDYCSPMRYEQLHDEKSRTRITGELPTAGQRHGRDRRPAGRPWTTRGTTQIEGNQPQDSTA